MWRKKNPNTLGVYIGAATMENSMEISQKTNNKIMTKVPLLSIYLKKIKTLT